MEPMAAPPRFRHKQSWQVAIVMLGYVALVPASNFQIETEAFNARLK
jgi:hypothetical protein